MKRLIKCNNEYAPSIIADKNYVMLLNSTNSTYNDDILEIAEKYGAVKVKYAYYSIHDKKYFNAPTYRFAIPNKETADIIFEEVKKSHIPTHQHEVITAPVDWERCYNIWIDDYAKGAYKLDWHADQKDAITSTTQIHASTEINQYVVHIFHEVEGTRHGLPDAAEEIYVVEAFGPEEAIAKAKACWRGPIDTVKVEPIDPDAEFDDIDIPFDFNDEYADYYENKRQNTWAFKTGDARSALD